MSKVSSDKGSCLCGAVTIATTSRSDDFGVCHCGMCRKWGGGPLFAVNGGTEVKITGEEFVSVFDSSEWAERGFCKKCGTHLFYRLKGINQYQIPVGLLENSKSLNFSLQVFIDEKPESYSFSETTKNLTGQEVYDLYAPKE